MIYPIVAYGSSILRKECIEIEQLNEEIKQLINDMFETMYDADGVGLAAPQIGVPLRVFVWDINDELGHLINPSLDLSSEMQEGEEGCLSFPNLTYETPRAFRAVAKGANRVCVYFV